MEDCGSLNDSSFEDKRFRDQVLAAYGEISELDEQQEEAPTEKKNELVEYENNIKKSATFPQNEVEDIV